MLPRNGAVWGSLVPASDPNENRDARVVIDHVEYTQPALSSLRLKHILSPSFVALTRDSANPHESFISSAKPARNMTDTTLTIFPGLSVMKFW